MFRTLINIVSVIAHVPIVLTVYCVVTLGLAIGLVMLGLFNPCVGDQT
jgi:hypothetical protein